MITVKTIDEAQLYFQPYNPSRPAETVTIYSGGHVAFLHWDPAVAQFCVEYGTDRQSFPGWQIDRMGQETQPAVDNVVSLGLMTQT